MTTVDSGSTLFLVVFAQEVLLLIYLLGREFMGPLRGSSPSSRPALPLTNADRVEAVDGLEDSDVDTDTQFLFDVVARQNEGIVQNIDALDNGLIAVAVGIIAVALFTGDKWFELAPNFRLAGLALLCESIGFALLGYVSIYFVEAGAEDIVKLTDFVVDFQLVALGRNVLGDFKYCASQQS